MQKYDYRSYDIIGCRSIEDDLWDGEEIYLVVPFYQKVDCDPAFSAKEELYFKVLVRKEKNAENDV